MSDKAPGHAHLRLATLINRADREGGIDEVTPPSPPLAPLIARAYLHGYALAVHGSLHRDLDLIAVAWTDDADSPEYLVDMLCQWEGLQKRGDWERRPHGRQGIILGKEGWYKPIDLSVIPPRLETVVQAVIAEEITESRGREITGLTFTEFRRHIRATLTIPDSGLSGIPAISDKPMPEREALAAKHLSLAHTRLSTRAYAAAQLGKSEMAKFYRAAAHVVADELGMYRAAVAAEARGEP